MHGLAVARGFLANIQSQHMEAKGFHQPDQVLQRTIGSALIVMADQRIVDQIKVLEELLPVLITMDIGFHRMP